MRYGLLLIYDAPTHYSAVFLLHAPTPAPIKIGFGAVRCGAVLAVVSVKLTPLTVTLPLWRAIVAFRLCEASVGAWILLFGSSHVKKIVKPRTC